MKNLKELARDAEDVQNACNLSGVLQSAAAAVVDLRRALEERGDDAGTKALNRHPITRAWAVKIADLSGVGIGADYPAEELRAIMHEGEKPSVRFSCCGRGTFVKNIECPEHGGLVEPFAP